MYNERIKKLLDNFDDIQKMLIEDLDQEGLEPDDIEFEQMINERTLSNKQKEEIYQFYKDKARIKKEVYLEELDKIEKETIEDLLSEGLRPGDPEFEQMINERTVNKNNIYEYFDNKKKEFLLNYSRNEKQFINQIIKDGLDINDKEFNERIKDSGYSKDKIIDYINNIKWIDKNNKIIKNNKKKEEKKETKIEDNKTDDNVKVIIKDGTVNDEVVIDDKKREMFNEIQKNLRKKEGQDNKVSNINIDNSKDVKQKKVVRKVKTSDPYKGMDYYQRLSAYAREKENNPSNLDSYDDELQSIKRKEIETKRKQLTMKKRFLLELKNKLNKKPNDLGDEDIKRLGFIDIFSISIVVIILGILFISTIKLFK